MDGGTGLVDHCVTEESILTMKGEKDGGDDKRDIVIRCWRAWNGMERCEVVSLVVSDHCFNESEMCWIWVSL